MVKLILSFGIFFFSVSTAFAWTQQQWQELWKVNPDTAMELQKRDYEFQERCGHSAAGYAKQFFMKQGRETDEKTHLLTFRNHYNSRLNKCFIYIEIFEKSSDGTLKLTEGPCGLGPKAMEIDDVNGNKSHGFFACSKPMEINLFGTSFPIDNATIVCTTVGKPCNSRAEWDAFIKEMMED